jgi:EAL domain-containing protein (putative c-di-GMP-specific phosphodiesterase class I)
VLRRLRALGVKVSLDDFGSGFASLGYLRRFRLDKIKLDRSFIQSIAVDPQARRITNAVVELGRALDIPVTAEGVETEEQARLVRAAGCELQQGFFYSRPMSAGELATFVRDGAAAARPAARLGAVPVDA